MIRKFGENYHSKAIAPSRIPAPRYRKTKNKQQKHNKPARHQDDQIIAKPANQQQPAAVNKAAGGKGYA